MPRGTTVSPFCKQCFVVTAVGLNIICHGCATGFPAILLPQLRMADSPIQLTTEEESWIASMHVLNMLVGNLIASPLIDRLGRKGSLCALTLPFIAGWIMTVLATNLKVLLLTRIILGISSGILSVLRSVLIGEYTSPKYRGAFLTTISLTQGFGIFLVHLLGSFFSWPVTALICSFIPFTGFLMIIYIPESPSWLASKGRFKESSEVFRQLRGKEEEEELAEMIEAQMTLEKLNNKKCPSNHNRLQTVMKTFLKKEFYKPIILMIHANVLLVFAGSTIMANYSIEVLHLLMGPTADVYFWTLFIDIQRIVTNLVAIFIIYRVKRRTILFSNGVVCVIVHLAIFIYIYGKIQGWMQLKDVWLPALLINIQFFTIGMAMVPMPSIIAGEVFPLEYRGIGGTISMASLAIAAFFIVKTFPGLVEAMGLQGTYLLYSIILTYNLFVIWILLPETKGRTLQQIEVELRGISRTLNEPAIDQHLSEELSGMIQYKRKLSERKQSIILD